MITDQEWIGEQEFTARTGWAIKPSGACKGDVCIPLPPEARGVGGLSVRTLSDRLGMALVTDKARGLIALGPATNGTGKALTSAEAPDLVLPDLDGTPFRLADLRGQKVLIVAWASWCGCRMDLPQWQQKRQQLHPRGLEIVTVAMDVEGAEAARPWIEAAAPRHPALIDAEHLLGALFGVVNVPMGIWIDENGMIVRPPEQVWPGATTVLDIDISEMRPEAAVFLEEVKKIPFDTERSQEMLLDWVEKGSDSVYALDPDEVVARSAPRNDDSSAAAAHFELGQYLHRQGDHAGSVEHWTAAHHLQPENWTYKRQAWEIEDPGLQGPTDVYEGNWLADVIKIGAENYYARLE